ncbi:MAG: hypothetical protein IKF82_07515 [Bacilli bacterium]|nr:hypothetical protein [Bacilli bacterium]
MQTFIEKILNDERDYFLKEKEAEELKLTRGKQTPKEARDSDIWHCAALGILEEINYIMEKITYNFKTGFYSFSIKGEVVENEDGSIWPKFYTFIKILVKGEENKGPQEKPIFIKFNKTIKGLKNLKNGFLVVEKSNFIKPPIYEIKEENGVKKYPFVTVNEIFSFDPESQEE